VLRFFAEYHEGLAEAMAILVVLIIVRLTPPRYTMWLRTIECRLGRIAQRQGLSVMLVGLLALGSSATLSLLGRVPEPSVHDEFSYLLAADTFSRGRLSNPVHPLWMHFESFHILQQPIYASKYPPAQGLMLALGQLIGGRPIVGVWISTALACVAVYWMLLAWLPAGWALLGGGLTAVHPSILLWWGQTYWGGTVAMLGGALVFGALRRIIRQPKVRDSLLLGIGLAVLANSRLYEGLVASLPVAVVLLVWMLGKKGPTPRVAFGEVILPILTVLAVTGGAMGFYNWRLTGDALRMPYQVYEEAYASAPLFLWQQPSAMPNYRHPVMREFYLFNDYLFKEQHTLQGLARMTWHKVKTLWINYQGGRYLRLGLTIPLLMLPWLVRNHWTRFALLTCCLFTVGLLVEPWVQTHYAAPLTAVVVMLVLQATRHLRLWHWRGRPVGRFLVWTLVVITVVSFSQAFAQHMQRKATAWEHERARILRTLKADGRQHLVIVRYGPKHLQNYEWVYNDADIDGARVVWAREMEGSQTHRLLQYFQDRQVWLVEINDDDRPPKLLPYPIEVGQ
jgi:hypothetical protein